jgi:hypothetical protein
MIVSGAGLVQADNRNSVFVGAGFAKPENIDTTFYVTAGGRWEFAEHWAVDPDFGYWRANAVERQCPGPGCAVYDLRDVHAGASLVYVGAYRRVDIFVGGGAAAHFRKRIANLPPGSDKTAPEPSETRLGLHILSGVDVPLSRAFGLTFGVRANFIQRDEPLENQFVLTGHGGIRFYF